MQFSNSKIQPFKKKRNNATYYNIICIGQESSGRKSIFETYKKTQFKTRSWNNVRKSDEFKEKEKEQQIIEEEPPPLTMGFLSLISDIEKKSMDDISRKRNVKRETPTLTPIIEPKPDGSVGFLSLIEPPSVSGAKVDGSVGFLSLIENEIEEEVIEPIPLPFSSLSTATNNISNSPSSQRKSKYSFSQANHQINVHYIEEFAEVNINTDDFVGFIFVFCVSSRDSFAWIKKQIGTVFKLASSHSAIMLGSKCDELRVVSFSEADALAKKHNLPYIECSAKEHIQVEESIDDILYQLEYEYDAQINWDNAKREIKEKLSLAVLNRNIKKIKSLVSKEQPNVVGRTGWAPIHVACWEGCFEIVFIFLQVCPQCTSTLGKDNWTPLHIASRMGFVDITHLLLNSGANVFDKDSLGRSPADGRSRKQRDLILSRITSRRRNQSKDFSIHSLLLNEMESSDLDLSYSSLSSLPQEIFRFPNLTWISFSHCGLTSIDPLLCECKQLLTLILSSNSIIQLPDQISHLSNLEHIDLRNNRITSLPLSFGDMKSLKRCYLSYNLLSYLPSSMENFEKSIEALDLYGNPLNTLPPDLVPKLDIHPSEMPHLFAYLRDIKEGQQEYNRIKIMLVGDGNVGKTSLGNCFAEKDPKKVHRISTKLKKKDPTDTIATDGIDISEVVISLVGKDIVWDVWDYAGQEIYYTTHQFFLTKRAIYLVIFNLLDRNLTRVEYWLNSIHTRARGSPIILVGTHSDSKECTEEYLTEFTNNLMKCVKPERFKSKLGVKSVKAIYFVSSRKRMGIKDLMDGIKDTVAKQKWEGQLFPSSWVKLEEAVSRLKRSGNTPFFQWNDFKRMAETVGVPPNSVKDATLFLHSIGCLCYFDEVVSGLNEIVIIDPQFLTNVMSSIITLKHRFGQAVNAEGVLLTSQLPHIWKDFPSGIHPMLLKLMESFEIFFRLPSQAGDNDQRIVIPSLLSEIQPNLKSLGWNISLGQKAAMLVVGRVYNFEFLPLGFFPRLFVRNFHIPNVQITSFWRHGMLIESDDTKALLRFNPARYRLTLDITSSSTSFHESVKLLRLLVENIESTIEGWYETKVEILVPCPHCVSQGSYDPWKFSINECLQAITQGIGYVLCQNIRRIRLDLVAPDLSFVDFQRLVIPYESLQMEVVIGQGAFGTVYKGVISEDPSTLVAIKQLSFKNAVSQEAEYASELKSKFSEFQREVWIMSCLKHNNVCGLIAITNSPMTMVIDYLPMGDLFRLIDAYPRIDVMMLSSMELKLKLIFEIAKGIHHLHSLSPPIIHRDLRSPNIFILSLDIGDPISAKIGDFGLSRLISSPLAGGDFNANWLAPEVMKGDKYDHKLDVYSFGIIMWEILSLKKPFEEYDSKYAGKPKNMFYSDVIGGLRPTIPPDCDPDYQNLMIRCWDGQPSARPEFHDILNSIQLILIKNNVPFPIDINNEGMVDLYSTSSLRSTSLSDNFTDTVEQMEIVKLTQQLVDPIHPQSIQKILTVSEKDEITIWTATASGDILIWDSLTLNFMMQFRITKLRIYDMVSMNGEVWVATDDGSIISVSTSKDHKILYTIYEHSQSVRSLAKFDISSTSHLPFGSKKSLKSSSSSYSLSKSNYSIVLSGDLDGTVNIWRTHKRKYPKLKNKFKVPQPVGAIIHKGDTIYIGTDGPIYMFDIITNTLNPIALNGHINLITGMIFASQRLWTCSNDGSLRIWDINNNTCLQELKAHSSKVLCISSIGSYVFTGSFDMILAVWDSKSGELLQELKGVHKDGIRSILTLGDTILTGGLERDPVICVWKLTGRTGIRRSLLSRQRRS